MVARSEEYYLRTVARGREEYYTGSGESPGTWVGAGSRLLGLEGEVDPNHLRAVLAGASPEGEILVGSRLADSRRICGFDLTFSAPDTSDELALSEDLSQEFRQISTRRSEWTRAWEADVWSIFPHSGGLFRARSGW